MRMGSLRVAALAGLALVWAVSGSLPLAGEGPPRVRRVNVPDLTGKDFAPAIFWLGSVGPTANYADVRVWHYTASLRVAFHVADRLLWHDSAPSPERLASWDAVSVYIDMDGNSAISPGRRSYRFVKQLGNDADPAAMAAYRGDGTGWLSDAAPFNPTTVWRGNSPNDSAWDMGWQAEFQIPFASLGLTGPPPPGTTWGFAVVVHDRDDAAGSAIPDQVWPEGMQGTSPATWGQLRFGLPVHPPSSAAVTGTTVVRNGFDGAVVTDAAVGGHTICGEPMNAWTEWGNRNYAGYWQFNIQNQWDIADFMCYSKYYVTFPLTEIPPGKSVVSARVTMHLFGNSGYKPGDAKPSSIHAITVAEDWAEGTITWNNAPYASENVATTRVDPVDDAHPAGPYHWDVSYAAAEAYRQGKPLRLAFYSADGNYHSGK